jgi:8-oxo-dGTP pyrophosphatase MutT (NUDIX family)
LHVETQLVKGTIEKGEQPRDAAARELFEESGLVCPVIMQPLGILPVGKDCVPWHFFLWHSVGLPDAWSHAAEDDFSHTFEFFWHPVKMALDE